MTRLRNAFQTGRSVHLIPYLMAGDPDLETTLDIVELLEEEAVTAIELGVPFSDPTADGPVIQLAGERALKNRVTLTDVLQLGEKARKRGLRVPLILFTYVNPVLQYGVEELVDHASQIGFDGLIIPDLSYEESDFVNLLAKKRGISLIPLVAPTSHHRIEQIVSQANGFVYCISSLGTTGVRSQFANDVESFLKNVRNVSPVPIAVGFGISEKSQIQYFSNLADGVIVGSALVKRIEEEQESLKNSRLRANSLARIRAFVRDLKSE